MVDMDAQLINGISKKNDGVSGESLELCAQANGDMISHLEDRGIPPTSAGVEGNTKGSALCLIMHIPNGECLGPEPQNMGCFQSESNEEAAASPMDCSPRTPETGVFDPFAAGPDEMLLAPICKKLMKEPQKIIVRRLNFDSAEDFPEADKNADSLSEKMLVESVTLLEAIVLKQSEELSAENGPLEMDVFQTPTSPQPLTGDSETCPGAPMKVAAIKLRDIDQEMCRKLEF